MAVVALSGRRADAPGAKVHRFPPENTGMVQERIRAALGRLTARVLVCSAACGADLVALAAAGEIGLRRRVVLPFAEGRFRKTSVVDRGEEWGVLFDRTIAELRQHGDIVTLEDVADETAAYAAANTRILDEAQSAAAEMKEDVVAVLVWEGGSRGKSDLTEAFGREARLRGLHVLEVLST
jgi:hypothetical protein